MSGNVSRGSSLRLNIPAGPGLCVYESASGACVCVCGCVGLREQLRLDIHVTLLLCFLAFMSQRLTRMHTP